jgi:ribonuclease P protein subunit POP4
MPLTPETLPRHELAGLPVRVVDATDAGRVGTGGTVVRETERTLVVRTDSGVTQVPKRGTTFEFTLTDEAAAGREPAGTAGELPSETAGHGAGQSGGCEPAAYVTVDGDVLLARPARRTEQEVDSTWH